MKEISKEEILTAWSNTEGKTGVYIHSPFCKEQCTYCTFKGTLFEKTAFDRYYSEYLPNQIKFYEPILSSDLIRNYFWGGGTPTLMSAEIMRNIFDLIPNFKECPRKLMEFHNFLARGSKTPTMAHHGRHMQYSRGFPPDIRQRRDPQRRRILHIFHKFH